MTLGNIRELGVHRLIASCLNDACRDQALIEVSSYPGGDRGVQKNIKPKFGARPHTLPRPTTTRV